MGAFQPGSEQAQEPLRQRHCLRPLPRHPPAHRRYPALLLPECPQPRRASRPQGRPASTSQGSDGEEADSGLRPGPAPGTTGSGQMCISVMAAIPQLFPPASLHHWLSAGAVLPPTDVGQCLGTLLWSPVGGGGSSDSWRVGPGMLLHTLPCPGRPHSARSGPAWQPC